MAAVAGRDGGEGLGDGEDVVAMVLGRLGGEIAFFATPVFVLSPL